MRDLGTPDPQWDFALAIRRALEAHGRYVIEVDTDDGQAHVDILWAARQAGRLLGVEVEIDRSRHPGRADSIVTATIRCARSDSPERARARAGLERLRQAVREAALTAGSAPGERQHAR
jgi:hypothetical protein